MSGIFTYWPQVSVIVVLWLIVSILTRNLNPLHFAVGEDNRFSISKLQFLLWTVAVLFGYLVVLFTRYQSGNFAPLEEIPGNLLIAMGLSGATAILAKGAKVNNIEAGRELDDPLPKVGSFSTVVTEDDGSPSLVKVQYLIWTLVAIGVFIAAVDRDHTKLPDIDGALVVLSGLGAGTYLGKKLIPQNAFGANGASTLRASRVAGRVTSSRMTTATTTIQTDQPVATDPAIVEDQVPSQEDPSEGKR